MARGVANFTSANGIVIRPIPMTLAWTLVPILDRAAAGPIRPSLCRFGADVFIAKGAAGARAPLKMRLSPPTTLRNDNPFVKGAVICSLDFSVNNSHPESTAHAAIRLRQVAQLTREQMVNSCRPAMKNLFHPNIRGDRSSRHCGDATPSMAFVSGKSACMLLVRQRGLERTLPT